MKSLLSIIMVCGLWVTASGQSQSPVGIFDNHTDVGNPKKAGSAAYDQSTQEYKISGSGYNIWFGRDEFHYAYKKLKGDFILTANFEFVGKGVDPHRKIGWMVRSTADDNSAHVSATVHGDGLTVLQWRVMKGAWMRDPEDEIRFSKSGPQIVQLERTGGKYIMRAAHRGEPLQVVGEYRPAAMGDEVLAGIFISSHNESVIEEATVWNVRVDRPVPPDYNTDRSGFVMGCRMETMNVLDGRRKVIHESTGRFEAPNWMPDGKKLLFNEGGSLYTLPVEGGTPEKVNTEFADRCNNDHMISFDGKTIAFSHHRSGLPGGGSTVYTVPIGGGTPKLLTDKTPSYLHGWNPNNKEVVFVGQRDGKNYDIYKISVNAGQEVKLTSNTGYHVDGCEFSPDGKFIYYNGSQSGTMQLWRMKPPSSLFPIASIQNLIHPTSTWSCA